MCAWHKTVVSRGNYACSWSKIHIFSRYKIVNVRDSKLYVVREGTVYKSRHSRRLRPLRLLANDPATCWIKPMWFDHRDYHGFQRKVGIRVYSGFLILVLFDWSRDNLLNLMLYYPHLNFLPFIFTKVHNSKKIS